MRMKRIIFSLSLLLFMAGIYGQTGHITLEECQQKTQDNYPLVRQYDLVEKTKEYNLENAWRLPAAICGSRTAETDWVCIPNPEWGLK